MANGNNETTTIVTTTGSNNSQPQQIFHVSVEYEEEAKPKTKSEILQNNRKRRLITKDGTDIQQQQLLSQYVNQTLPSPSSAAIVKQTPTIIIDDKSQDQVLKEFDEGPKIARVGNNSDEHHKLDKFEVFGMFVANEMRSLSSAVLQNKMKRKILECILEINDDQEAENVQS